MQGTLFDVSGDIQTRLLARRRDFEALFDGFEKMRAVSYVVSTDLLAEFFDKRGYRQVEVVVGDGLAEPALRDQLRDKPPEILESLAGLVEKGFLRVLVPRRTIHTKLYILENSRVSRVIQTSANLTATARRARQVNYAWFADLASGHPFLERVVRDFEAHAAHGTVFMSDLAELLRRDSGESRREIIEVWLRGTAAAGSEKAAAAFFQDLSARALLTPGVNEATVLEVELPESPAVRKDTDKLLKPVVPEMSGKSAAVPALGWVNYARVACGVPLMRLDPRQRTLRLGLAGEISTVSAPPGEPAEVDRALAHLEDYMGTVDLAKSADPLFAKASMFEALLYFLFAPFAGQYMRARRRAYGQADPKGPRLLYVYGPSQNGKTTFFRFALKLLAGRQMEALERESFSRGRIRTAAAVGTVFPLVFDDVELSTRPWVQNVMKSYWETDWTADREQPQLLVSSNEPRLKDWARSRVKRVEFDVHFTSSGDEKRKLKEILEYDNPLFRWFAALYLETPGRENGNLEDELHVARLVMAALYGHAGRRRPQFFLDQPVEQRFDLGKKRWADILYQRREARLTREEKRSLVRFPEQMPSWEIRRFEGYLPPQVKARQEGPTIIIETPVEFDDWCPPPRRGLRLWRRG